MNFTKQKAVFLFLFFTQISWSQEPVKRFEFGSTILTFNALDPTDLYDYFGYDDNYNFGAPIEFFNALFFRFTKNRLALRLLASYSDNSYPLVYGWGIGNAKVKDFQIGAGGQFSVLKHQDWFYTFIDLSYRSVFTLVDIFGKDRRYSDHRYKYSTSSNGFDCFLGIGSKIRLLNYLYLSPELSICSTTKFVEFRGRADDHNYSETQFKPIFKLHLTVKF